MVTCPPPCSCILGFCGSCMGNSLTGFTEMRGIHRNKPKKKLAAECGEQMTMRYLESAKASCIYCGRYVGFNSLVSLKTGRMAFGKSSLPFKFDGSLQCSSLCCSQSAHLESSRMQLMKAKQPFLLFSSITLVTKYCLQKAVQQ